MNATRQAICYQYRHLHQSTPIQQRYEVARVPLCAETAPSDAKRNQERDWLHRRPRWSWPDRATSHRVNSRARSSDRCLSFANVQSLGTSRSGIERYANDTIPGDLPNPTFRATQTPTPFPIEPRSFPEEAKAPSRNLQITPSNQTRYPRINPAGSPPHMLRPS